MNASGDGVVCIVDDDAAVRDSISFLVEAEGFKSALYESSEALLADAPHPAGCIVTDVRMPGMTGLELIAELKRRGATQPIIVLTGHADVAMAVEAMKAGAFDFLEKPFDGEKLLERIRAALARADDAASQSDKRKEIEERMAQLTAREREVFSAIVAGESNKVAALRLGISPRTVEIYRANVMTKMRAHSLSELVRLALTLER